MTSRQDTLIVPFDIKLTQPFLGSEIFNQDKWPDGREGRERRKQKHI